MPVRIVNVTDGATAFAMALKWAARHAPFRDAPAGPTGRTILHAVRRGHVRFVVDDGGRVAGFGCWALVDEAAARRWRDENVPPESDLTDGDTVALLMGAADHPQAAGQAMRYMARLYPGRAYMMRRSQRKQAVMGRFPGALGHPTYSKTTTPARVALPQEP